MRPKELTSGELERSGRDLLKELTLCGLERTGQHTLVGRLDET
jgi:hypothetical protein